MPPRFELRPEFAQVLSDLRRRIRTFVLVEGTARLVILLALLFWGTLALDWLWFQISRLELPQWFRTAVVLGCLGGLAFGLMTWLVLRFLPGLRAKALALVLEKRFPELDDRLITAVEMAEAPPKEQSPLSQAMLNRTIDDAARLVPNLQLGSVFEKSLLQRMLTFAVVLVISVVGFGVLNAPAMDRWYKAYILREDLYWHRDTDLVVKALVAPWNEPRPFDDHTYKHPRGGDLQLVVEVPEGKRPDGGEWTVPDFVQLSYVLDNGRGSQSVTLFRYGDRQFRHTIGNVIDGMHLWVRGGDFANRQPYRVEVVSPPQMDSIQLDCDFPGYTGLNDTSNRLVTVQGKDVTVPEETRFVLRGKLNKPVRKVWVEFGTETLAFGWGRQEKSLYDRKLLLNEWLMGKEAAEQYAAVHQVETSEEKKAEARPVDGRTEKQLLAEDRQSFAIPMIITTAETAAARGRADEPLSGFGAPFVVSPGTAVRIYLEDTDDILATEPARLTINASPDQPPVVQTELKGIGTSITRRAIIPVKGLLTDDYGLAKARFEYRLDDGEEWIPGNFRRKIEGTPKEWQLAATPEMGVEQFDILPLDLAVGKKLTLTVIAEDLDDLNGPHKSHGEQFVFTLVSNEELLSIMYGREVNLRQRFRQIMDEVEGTRKDLILHKVKHQEAVELGKKPAGNEPEAAKDAAKREELEISVAVAAERALHQVRKNAGETAAIEESFRALLEELVNNRVHTEQMVQRIDGLIVAPLRAVNQVDFPSVDGSIGLFKLALEKKQDPVGAIDNSVEAITEMLSHMEKILKEMQDLAEFHEAIKELKVIIDDSEAVRKETIRKQKEEILNRFKTPEKAQEKKD